MRIEEKIEQLVTDSISSYLNGNLVYSTQVLDYIFPKERRIRAIIGGLETSLGTKLWEQLAKLLASENGFEVLDEKIFNTNDQHSYVKLPEASLRFLTLGVLNTRARL